MRHWRLLPLLQGIPAPTAAGCVHTAQILSCCTQAKVCRANTPSHDLAHDRPCSPQVTNDYGSVMSNGARVEVVLPPGRPVILRQPTGCLVPHLSSFGLSVRAVLICLFQMPSIFKSVLLACGPLCAVQNSRGILSYWHNSQPHACAYSWRPQVLAAGDAPLAYQWWQGSTPVAGATSPILAVAGARKALHQGVYTVQVSS
jgi:hypothetical protein